MHLSPVVSVSAPSIARTLVLRLAATHPLGTVVLEDLFLVQGTDLALVTLPGHIDRSNADQVREQLLLAINRGVAMLIADMTATVSCDSFGADALASAGQRADASGTQLRLGNLAGWVRPKCPGRELNARPTA